MNNIIEKLNNKISEVGVLADAARESSDFASKLELKSLEYHLEELQTQLRHEKLLRSKEVFELRVKGLSADQGTIPLDILSGIAKHLSGSLHSLAYRLKKGSDPRGRIPKDVIRTLDLQLAGLAYGSTKLYFSASLNPNLFGYSLIEDSLEKTFKVFSSASPEELIDSVSDVGIRSAGNINRLLKTFSNHDLEVDLIWTDSQENTHKWEGSSDSILGISNTLDSVLRTFKESVVIDGELMMLHKKGKFEIRPIEGGPNYLGAFPIDIMEEVIKIRIGQIAVAEIETEITTNQTTGYEKKSYTLMSLKSKEE